MLIGLCHNLCLPWALVNAGHDEWDQGTCQAARQVLLYVEPQRRSGAGSCSACQVLVGVGSHSTCQVLVDVGARSACQVLVGIGACSTCQVLVGVGGHSAYQVLVTRGAC